MIKAFVWKSNLCLNPFESISIKALNPIAAFERFRLVLVFIYVNSNVENMF